MGDFGVGKELEARRLRTQSLRLMVDLVVAGASKNGVEDGVGGDGDLGSESAFSAPVLHANPTDEDRCWATADDPQEDVDHNHDHHDDHHTYQRQTIPSPPSTVYIMVQQTAIRLTTGLGLLE